MNPYILTVAAVFVLVLAAVLRHPIAIAIRGWRS